MKRFLSRMPGFRRALALFAAAVLVFTLSACDNPAGPDDPEQHTIAFESHGGTAVQAITAAAGTAVEQPAVPTRTGYAFADWHSAETGGTLYTWPHTLTADLTMHAHWREDAQPPPVQHTITFESHGGTAVEAVTAAAGTAVEKPTDPVRDGYAFAGWHSAETGGTLYAWPHTLTAGLTMHAHWQENHTITFESHGGTAVEAVTAAAGTAVGKPTDPVRDGYAFFGWHSAETGGTLYAWPYALNGDVVMHAQWWEDAQPPPARHTITFESHGGAAVDTVTAAAGTAVEQPADPTRTGYGFAGWHSAETGGTLYAWPYPLSGDVTMHAQWTVVSYSISYNLNGGTGAANSAYTIESSDISLPANPTKMGYTFGGWFENSGFAGAATTVIAAGSAGDKTFHAKWTALVYSISYRLNGGTGAANSAYTIESSDISLPANPTKRGYAFSGWFENSGFAGDPVVVIPSGSMGDKTFYAQWTAAVYHISYNPNGGTNAPGNPEAYTIESPGIVLGAPTRAGYAFDGWHDNPELTGDPVAGIPPGSMGDKAFYAKWTLIIYTLIFESRGGTEVETVRAMEGTPVAKPADPEREGYTFGGWRAEGGAEYTWPHILNGDVTMYALWVVIAPVDISIWINEDGDILSSNGDITISQSGSGYAAGFTASVTSEYTGVQWNLNGIPMFGSAVSVTINAADYELKSHVLGVVVYKDGIPYSKNIRFTVVE
jgi:uncharacterized repeat protein (TIGR02543 family)